jgi:hypothetical protein
MEWFKHATGSHEDPDISDAWDTFGDAGPVIFWTILEVFGSEYSHLKDGWLTLSIPYFERKLRRKCKKTEKILEFFQKRERIFFKIDQNSISLTIPKFIKIASNWTTRPQAKPTALPTEAPTEARHAKEEEEKRIEKDMCPPAPPLNGNCPHQEIINLYHEILPQLPQVKLWTDSRKKTLQCRWKEEKERQNLDWWRKYFKDVKQSPFLLGENERKFRADLEWLIAIKNMAKVLEGKYTQKKSIFMS